MATPKKTPKSSYSEVVFKGKPKVVRAFLFGLDLGSGNDGQVYFSYDEGIDQGKAPRFAEKYGLPGTDVHVVVDSVTSALLKKLTKRIKPENNLAIVSHRRIRSAKMDVSFEAFAPRYEKEIMDFLRKVPAELKLRWTKADVRKDADAKGVEAYSAVHHYEARGEGTIAGPVGALVEFKRACGAYPLIKTEEIKLSVG